MRRAWLLPLMAVAAATLDMKIEPPKITEPTQDRIEFVIERKKITLKCKAEGTPKPTYNWQRSQDGGNSWVNVMVDNVISLDSSTGDLIINEFYSSRFRDDAGMYMCLATNVYEAQGERTQSRSMSPIITVEILELPGFSDTSQTNTYTANEYDYVKLPCIGVPETAAISTFSKNWNTGPKPSDSNTESTTQVNNQRSFVDSEGNLHISYVKRDDASIELGMYKCSLGSDKLNKVLLSGPTDLKVVNLDNAPGAIKPELVHSSQKVQALKDQTAFLECVFKGYDPAEPAPHLPKIRWFDRTYKEIQPSPQKYSIDAELAGRRLEIKQVQEADTGTFYCQGYSQSSQPSEMHPVELQVVSKPIFDNYESAPHDSVTPEGKDAVFHCNARNAIGDEASVLEQPIWYINGQKAGNHLDPNKHVIDTSAKTLTVRSLSKATDVGCIQCTVKNNQGMVLKDGCITVITPIQVTYHDPYDQIVEYGQLINLTVEANTDIAYRDQLQWSWVFKNQTYTDAPPEWMYYNADTKKAYINTSLYDEDEYTEYLGVYTRVIQHPYDKREVRFTIEGAIPVTPKPILSAGGFDMWILGLIVGILFLIVVIVIIVFIICRKQQEGDYNVDRKEHIAGLDPEKELQNKAFEDYSRPDYSDYPYSGVDTKPRGDIEYDDVPMEGDDESLGEYGHDEATHFTEDGSFIGVYQKGEKNGRNSHYGNQSQV